MAARKQGTVQLNVIIDETLRQRVSDAAWKQRISMSKLVAQALEAYLRDIENDASS